MNWREGKDPLGLPCELLGPDECPVAIVTKDWHRYAPHVPLEDDGEMVLWVIYPWSMGPRRLHGFAKDFAEAKRLAETALMGLQRKGGAS